MLTDMSLVGACGAKPVSQLHAGLLDSSGATEQPCGEINGPAMAASSRTAQFTRKHDRGMR